MLTITTLNYADQVTKPPTFASDLPAREAAPAELALMHTLVDACTPPRFDYPCYQDQYAGKLQQLLDAKVAGQKLLSPPTEEAAALHNLLESLQKSVPRRSKPATVHKRLSQEEGWQQGNRRQWAYKEMTDELRQLAATPPSA